MKVEKIAFVLVYVLALSVLVADMLFWRAY